MLQVCRTCLHQISDTSFVSLTSNSKSSELKKQLAFCVPEMTTNLVSEPIMCIPCITALHSAYIFKNQCLQTEERIRAYIESKNIGINLLDIFQDPSNISAPSNLDTPVPNDFEKENDSSKFNDVYIKEEYAAPPDSESFEVLQLDNGEVKYDIPSITPESTNEIPENSVEHVPLAESSTDTSPHQQKLQELIKKKSKHQRPHIERPHKCEKCPFSTADRSTLNKHRSIHSDERPHQCTICKYRTKRKDALTLHMKLHQDEKPYSCPECKYSAITKQRLRTHVMVAHLELKPYKCERCDFSAAERGTVVKHMLTHTDVKPFQCKLCNFCTKRKYTLKKHMISHGIE